MSPSARMLEATINFLGVLSIAYLVALFVCWLFGV
jgi:hypothetical protein